MGNAGTRKVTVVLQSAAINFSTPLTPTTPTALSPTCSYRWGWGGPCLPHETNYLSIPSGWFLHKPETNVLGYCLRLSLTGPLFENRSVSCSKEQTKETTIGCLCGFKLGAVTGSPSAIQAPSGRSV